MNDVFLTFGFHSIVVQIFCVDETFIFLSDFFHALDAYFSPLLFVSRALYTDVISRNYMTCLKDFNLGLIDLLNLNID